MISLIVKSDRVEFNNHTLKDYAVATLSNRPDMIDERSVLLYQFGNKKNFIYFLFTENIPIAIRILKEGHDGYLQVMHDLIEQNRKYNLKLQPKEISLPERVERVLTQEEQNKHIILLERSKYSK